MHVVFKIIKLFFWSFTCGILMPWYFSVGLEHLIVSLSDSFRVRQVSTQLVDEDCCAEAVLSIQEFTSTPRLQT